MAVCSMEYLYAGVVPKWACTVNKHYLLVNSILEIYALQIYLAFT